MLRTVDLYTNGPREPLTWVLLPNIVEQVLIPPDTITYYSTDLTILCAGRQWSPEKDTDMVRVRLLIPYFVLIRFLYMNAIVHRNLFVSRDSLVIFNSSLNVFNRV